MTWRDYFTGQDNRYTVEIIEELLEALRDGNSMRAICKGDRMPSRETVRLWCEEMPDLALAITRAREIGYIDRGEKAVEDAKNAEDAALGRLAFDAERWFLGKMSKAFKDKVTVGGDEDNPIVHNHKLDLTGAPPEVVKFLAAQKLANEG